jgi:hypothetical protein
LKGILWALKKIKKLKKLKKKINSLTLKHEKIIENIYSKSFDWDENKEEKRQKKIDKLVAKIMPRAHKYYFEY